MTKKFKCPICSKVYIHKPPLYTHMEKEHKEDLNNMHPARYYFNHKYKKTTGKCIMCGRETEFNLKTERYERLCSEACKIRYREQFKERMMKRHGKITLTNDPDMQLKMQSRRKIAGVYTWSDKSAKFKYLGSYEKHALEFLDKQLGLHSQDIISPAEVVIEYEVDGKKRFYMPDIHIVSLNLLVEVKGSNNHYQKRDKHIEAAKDKAAEQSEYNYVKILDKKYDDFLRVFNELKAGKSDN